MPYNNKTPLEKAEYANETKGILISSLNNKGLNITSNDSFRDIANMVNNIVIPSNNEMNILRISKFNITQNTSNLSSLNISRDNSLYIFPMTNVIYNTSNKFTKDVIIFNKLNNNWYLWHSSSNDKTRSIISELYYTPNEYFGLDYVVNRVTNNMISRYILTDLNNSSNLNINFLNKYSSEYIQNLWNYKWEPLDGANLMVNINDINNYEFYSTGNIWGYNEETEDSEEKLFEGISSNWIVPNGRPFIDSDGNLSIGSAFRLNKGDNRPFSIIHINDIITPLRTYNQCLIFNILDEGWYEENSYFYIAPEIIANAYNITSDIIPSGLNIMNMDGTYTSDANATVDDIALGKTAYINGQKLVGNMIGTTNNPYSLMKYSKLLIDGGALYTDDQEICEFIFPSLYDSTYDYNLLPEAFQFSVLDKTNNSFKVYWMESLGGSAVYYDDINSQIYLYVDQGTPQLTYCSTLKIDNLNALPNWSNNINGINSEWIESLNKYSWNTVNMENLTSNIYFNLLDENYEFYISNSIINAPDVAGSAFSSQIREGYIAYDKFGRIINGSLATKDQVNVLNNKIIPGNGVINIKPTAGYYLANSTLSINNLGLANKIGLTADNLPVGLSILNLDGTYSSDANALAEDIVYGKTAYVNGIKITGTMENLEPVIQNQANTINNLYNTVNNLQAEVDNKGQYSNKFALVPGTKFSGSTFTSLPTELLDISALSNLDYMFNFCTNLIELDLSSWDISNINSLYGTFNYCNNLTNLDISTWNIGINIINLSQTFSGCHNLTDLDVSNWDVSNVTNISGIFAVCYNLTNLDVSNWNTGNITNIERAFTGCRNLTNLNIDNWNASKIRSISQAFGGCSNLTNLDVTAWNTNLFDVTYAFSGCNNLVNINVSNWKIDLGNVYNLKAMFQYCNNLSDTSIDSIINMCLNVQNIPNTYKNINNTYYYSPFINTNISNSRYQNRWTELTAAGWNY